MTYYPLSLSPAGIEFIEREEYFVDHFYLDSVGLGTIGYGSTMYKDGTKPKAGDTITEEAASDLLLWAVTQKTNAVSHLIRNPLNQNQQDSLISLISKIGVAGFTTSIVLRLINQNQNDPDIGLAWFAWNKGYIRGVLTVLPGLTKRRAREYANYIKPII